MTLYSLSQKVVSLILAVSLLPSVVTAAAIHSTSPKIVPRQDLVAPYIISPQLRATAGQPFTIYGFDYEPDLLAGVQLDGNFVTLIQTKEENPFTATFTIPSSTTAGVHVLTIVSGGYFASMNLDVCTTDNGDGCQAMIGILSTSIINGAPVDTVITAPQYILEPGETFKIIGEGFWNGSLSLSLDSSLLFGEVVADLTGHFVSQQFTMPTDLGFGTHNITAIQNLGCASRYCLHRKANAAATFYYPKPPP